MKLADILKTPGNVNNFLPEQPLATVKKKKVIPKHYRLSTAYLGHRMKGRKTLKRKKSLSRGPAIGLLTVCSISRKNLLCLENTTHTVALSGLFYMPLCNSTTPRHFLSSAAFFSNCWIFQCQCLLFEWSLFSWQCKRFRIASYLLFCT